MKQLIVGLLLISTSICFASEYDKEFSEQTKTHDTFLRCMISLQSAKDFEKAIQNGIENNIFEEGHELKSLLKSYLNNHRDIGVFKKLQREYSEMSFAPIISADPMHGLAMKKHESYICSLVH